VLLQSAASWCCYNQLACSHFLISFFLYLTIDSQEKRYYMLNDLWLFKGEFGYGLECLKEYRVTVSMHFSYIQIDHP
jgi:hypothetical protein